MNLNSNPQQHELARLLAACDDSAGNHILWVNDDGEVVIACLPDDVTPLKFVSITLPMRMRFQTFKAGDGFVGPAAAVDPGWVTEVWAKLLDAWPDSVRDISGAVRCVNR